jgi:hypothetical protein
MSKINAIVVGDSLSPQGCRLTSLLITFPRIILSELNTHRMLSKNSASSRAIPFKKMVEMVKTNPFIPIAWQKEHKGMQGTEYFSEEESIHNRLMWLDSRDSAIMEAEQLHKRGVTKQLCNRLLEPFMWHTVLISGTEWENFFDLRCPQYEYNYGGVSGTFRSIKDIQKALSIKATAIQDMGLDVEAAEIEEWSVLQRLSINKGQAEIHMMALAEAMWDAMNKNTPKKLKAGEWHIPFEDKISTDNMLNELHKVGKLPITSVYSEIMDKEVAIAKVKISTAMAARTSYTVVGDEKEVTYETLLGIHDKMAVAKPFHASPFEHCAPAMSDKEYRLFVKGNLIDYSDPVYPYNLSPDSNTEGWCRNYRGFIQYRHILEENQVLNK